MSNYSSEKELYSLARILSREFTKEKFKSFLIENDFLGSLFFGRRSEFSANQTMIAKRSKLFSLFEKNNIQIMTFDRLSDLLLQSPSLYRSSRQSVCSYVNGNFIWKSDIYKK